MKFEVGTRVEYVGNDPFWSSCGDGTVVKGGIRFDNYKYRRKGDYHSFPPWKDYRPIKTNPKEDCIGTLVVEEVEEHEDGSATYNFHFDEETKGRMAKVGIEFTLYCAAYGWDMQDALDSLKREA